MGRQLALIQRKGGEAGGELEVSSSRHPLRRRSFKKTTGTRAVAKNQITRDDAV